MSNSFINLTLHYKTDQYEEIYIVGNLEELGGWNKLVHKLELSDGFYWTTTIQNSNQNIEFKFVCHNTETNDCRWESSPRTLDFTEAQDQLYVWNYYKTQFYVNHSTANSQSLKLYLKSIDFAVDMKLTEESPFNTQKTSGKDKYWTCEVNIPMNKDITYEYQSINYHGSFKVIKENTLKFSSGKHLNLVNDLVFESENQIVQEKIEKSEFAKPVKKLSKKKYLPIEDDEDASIYEEKYGNII